MTRLEIVRVDGGWFVRLVAANNRIVWVTPGLHTRRRAAVRAVEIVAGPLRHSPHADWPEVTLPGEELPVEVREVDERWQS